MWGNLIADVLIFRVFSENIANTEFIDNKNSYHYFFWVIQMLKKKKKR